MFPDEAPENVTGQSADLAGCSYVQVAGLEQPQVDLAAVPEGHVGHLGDIPELLDPGHRAVEVEVIDLRTLRPIDQDTVMRSVMKTGKALIVHEDTLALGIGAEISAILSEHVFDSLDAPIKRLAGPEVPAMPFSPTLEDQFMVNTSDIVKALQDLASY